MIKQKGFHDSQGINFSVLFYFFQKLDLSVFVDLQINFSPDTLRVNLEVAKRLHLRIDCHGVCFKW